MGTSNSKEVWTLKEAKAHLAQILHLAEAEGPQYISADHPDGQDPEECKAFVVVPVDVWQETRDPDNKIHGKHLGKWLVENTPRGVGVKDPEYDESGRFVAFSDVVFVDDE